MRRKKNKKIDDEIEEETIDEEEVDEDHDEEEEEETIHKSHKLFNIIFLIILIVILIFVYSKYVGTKGLIVKEYRVESDILTSNFDGLKIVHFSDLYYKSTVDNDDLKNLVESINRLKPDIVVFTGDLVTRNVKLTEKDINHLTEELLRIEAKIGKYAIYGDNDYSFDNYNSVMSDSNFNILDNSYEEVFYKTNEPLYIVGLPSSIKSNIEIGSSFSFYDDSNRNYIIVLVHDGNTIKYIDETDMEVDLILGGHSLNGSVVIPFYGGILKEGNTYKYSKPEYHKGITNIYISSGIGTHKYAYRFLNKPSFNLYRLKAQ